jgi:Tannase and feruloyl esterase
LGPATLTMRLTPNLLRLLSELITLLACLALAACDGTAGSHVSVNPHAACARLSDLAIAPAAISLPTRGARVTTAAPAVSTSGRVEYCNVTGRIEPVDPSAPPILFELELPTAWNGKLVQVGGGGWDGRLDGLFNIVGFFAPPHPLERGYAMLADDSGHEAANGDASFAHNDEALRNFGGDALKKAHDVALAIVKGRYAKGPVRTYFVGGSNGGREALTAMQRWPEDYAGVVAIYPALAWTPLMLKLQRIGVAMRGDGGAGWFAPAKADALMNATLAACDALDGLRDGLIANPDACRFDPATLRCAAGGDSAGTCLSDAQLHTLATMTSRLDFPYELANGVTSMPGFATGADWAVMVGSSPSFDLPPDIYKLGGVAWFGDQFVRHVVLRDANADTLAFDPLAAGAQVPRLQQVSGMLDATSTDIARFIGKGGKLILLHGLVDSLVPPQPTIDYYRALVTRFGKPETDRSVRLYLVPGFGHTAGAFNPAGTLPLFDALETWVEKGVAPGDLVIADANPATAGRARPLCRYPAWPKYDGSGDPQRAASFRCAVD